ncbi:hypothetical protein [Alcanivorax xiamenensis]|nr:hypothetical protein [Alcanivorax xiamenensis]
MNDIVYFSKMFQAVPHLAQIARVLPGTFVSNRSSTLKVVRRQYPQLQSARYLKHLGPLGKGNRKLSGADVIVTGSPYREFLQPYAARKCTVFHGTYMFLSREALQANTHFDLLCIIGPRMQQMVERFADDIPVKAVRTGFLPFCEFPQRTEAHRHEVLTEMGLNPSQPTVVYTPSRRGIGSWDQAVEALLDTLATHYNLVLRPHPSQGVTPRSRDHALFRKLAARIEARPHCVLDLSRFALSTVLSVADLVISDANSPAEESLFYDVPQLFVETDTFSRDTLARQGEREGMHADDMARLLAIYDCGPSVHFGGQHQGPHDFNATVEDALARAAQHRSAREHYFSWVFGERDRQANQRVAAAIRQHLL